MSFKSFFSDRQKPQDAQPPEIGQVQPEPKIDIGEVRRLLMAEASLIEQHGGKYASMLAEYSKNDPNRLKQFPTFLDYTLSRNKELLSQISEVLKAKESCIDRLLKLQSKYVEELKRAKPLPEMPNRAKLLRMKEEIGESRLFIREETDKLDAVGAERQGSEAKD